MKRTELMKLTEFLAKIQVKGLIKYRGIHK